MLQPADGIEPAAHVELLGSLEEVRNRRVFFVTAKDLLGFQCPSDALVSSRTLLPLWHAMTRPLALGVESGMSYLSGW